MPSALRLLVPLSVVTLICARGESSSQGLGSQGQWGLTALQSTLCHHSLPQGYLYFSSGKRGEEGRGRRHTVEGQEWRRGDLTGA